MPGLDWMARYTCCVGCDNAGGPPDCMIRIRAQKRDHELCSSCEDLHSCTEFDWLTDHGIKVRTALKENRGRSKKERIAAMAGKIPWDLDSCGRISESSCAIAGYFLLTVQPGL